ncbi:hypothetical protein KAT36_03965 [Candidatus Pacearchaeota archaeon]|nr:hypothetical protein [Candidatus Pacearchaeota archaeon]
MIIGITGTLGARKGTTLCVVFGIRHSGASLFGRTTLSSNLGNWQEHNFKDSGDLL